MRVTKSISALTVVAFVLASCGGGSNSTTPVAVSPPPTVPPTRAFTVPAQESLSVADVQQVMAQAITEARARNMPATIAVTDRVGNVLAVFRMNGAPALRSPKGARVCQALPPLFTFQPVVLEEAQARIDTQQEGRRPGEQDDAVGRLDGAQQPPARGEDNVAETEGGEGNGREIECLLEQAHLAEDEVERGIEPDLHGVEAEDTEHDEQDQGRLAHPVLVRLQALAAALHEVGQEDEPPEVDEDGDRDHPAGDEEVFGELDHFRGHGFCGYTRLSGFESGHPRCV